MLRRLRLEATHSYEIALGVHALAEMLASYVDGLEGTKSVGREQHPIDSWDDLVVEMHDGTKVHRQIKRNFDDFSVFDVDRGNATKSKGPNKHQPQDLSELDVAMAKLAKWLTNQPWPLTPPRRFEINAPGLTQLVKDDLPLRLVLEATEYCRKIMVTADSFAERTQTDSSTGKIETWMRTWCGFADPAAAFAALRLLDVVVYDRENLTKVQTLNILRRYFEPAELAYSRLRDLLIEDATDDTAFTAPVVYTTVGSLLRADRAKWTHFREVTEDSWTVAGLADMAVLSGTESIENLWRAGTGIRTLHLAAPWHSGSSMRRALARLAIHLPTPNLAVSVNSDGWTVGVSSLVGGTLGDRASLRPNLISPGCCVSRPADEAKAFPATEAAGLQTKMDDVTWGQIVSGVDSRLGAIASPELRAPTLAVWRDIGLELSGDSSRRSEFLRSLFELEVEGAHVDAQLRVGPTTVELAIRSVVLLTLYCTALVVGPPYTSVDGRPKVVALEFYSELVRGQTRVVELDMVGATVLGREGANRVLFAIYAEPSSFGDTSLAASSDIRTPTIAEPSRREYVTFSHEIRRILISQQSSVETLREAMTRHWPAPAEQQWIN